jgi:hypothetical protein
MEIIKKEPRNKAVTTKFTKAELKKLNQFAKSKKITRSNLIYQLTKLAYQEMNGEEL